MASLPTLTRRKGLWLACVKLTAGAPTRNDDGTVNVPISGVGATALTKRGAARKVARLAATHATP